MATSPSDEEQGVGKPHREPGRDLSVHRPRFAGGEEDVVAENDGHGDRESGRPAAAPRDDPERHSDESEEEAGGGEGELLLDLHAGRPALVEALFRIGRRPEHFREALFAEVLGAGCPGADPPRAGGRGPFPRRCRTSGDRTGRGA